jgi:hypothetical protein
MKRLLLAGLALASLAGPARAADPQHHDWWLLDLGSRRCIQASATQFSSPAIAYEALQRQGKSPEIVILNNDDGTVDNASVRTGAQMLSYYPSHNACETRLAWAIKSVLPPPPDLSQVR